jgi:CDP-glycerol glycerophosphotransferase (TagB/SpsB family)
MRNIFRSKNLRVFWQVLLLFICMPLFIIGYLIPKKKNLWIAGNVFGQKDNAFYFFEFAKDIPEIKIIWISKEHTHNPQCYYYLSIKGLYYQYRSAVAILSTGRGDVARFTLAGKKLVQLWHGIPIKKILLDSREFSPCSRVRGIDRVLRCVLRKNLSKYSLITAANELNKNCLVGAFGVSSNIVCITGLPRHDFIYTECKNAIKVHREHIKILFAPTWRVSTEKTKSLFNWLENESFVRLQEKYNIFIDVCIHPLSDKNESTYKSELTNYYNGMDINKDLCQYDLLITDYSSIALDFSVLDKPIVFYCPDFKYYVDNRGIYEHYAEMLSEKMISNDMDLVDAINEFIHNRNKRDFFINEGFLVDGGSCQRIYFKIKELL